MRFRFTAELWEWTGQASWYFVTVPPEASADIREIPLPPHGFGSVRVRVAVGGSRWTTSVFPDSSSGCYVLPIKKAVRVAEEIAKGDAVDVTIELAEL